MAGSDIRMLAEYRCENSPDVAESFPLEGIGGCCEPSDHLLSLFASDGVSDIDGNLRVESGARCSAIAGRTLDRATCEFAPVVAVDGAFVNPLFLDSRRA
jgi:hypothetical protein